MNDRLMKRFLIVALLVVPSVPAMAKTHKDMFEVSCTTLWPAVKDVLRNSGKYGIIGIDNTEMTASYNIGAASIGRGVSKERVNCGSRGFFPFFLPLWEKVERTKSMPDEGFLSIDRPEPLTRLKLATLI